MLFAVTCSLSADKEADSSGGPQLLFHDIGPVYDTMGLDNPQKPVSVKGLVYLDGNENSARDKGEPGVAGVSVSDGRQVVKTVEDGSFELSGVTPGLQRFIFVTVPDGCRIGGDFYRRIPVETGDMSVEFALKPDPDSRNPDHSIIHITDPHGGIDFIKELSSELGDFAVLTGDIVNCPISQNDRFTLIHDALEKAPVTVMPVPGNHDVLRMGSGEIVRRDALGEDGVLYEDVFGPSYYSFNYGGRHYIVLFSTAERDRQHEWMQNDIEAQPENVEVVILQHYPPNPDQMEFYQQFNVRAIFTGHTHADLVFQCGDILYVNTLGVSHSRDYSPQTIRVAKFEGDKILLENYSPGYGNQSDVPERPVVKGAAEPVKTKSDWPTFQGNAGRTGVAGDKLSPVLEVAWKQQLGGSAFISFSPIVVDGVVYVGLADRENRGRSGVHALDAATGEKLWFYPTVSGARICYADSRVYAAVQDGTLHAIAAETGKKLWTTRIEEPLLYRLLSAPLVWDDFVFAGNGKYFGAFDKESGEPVWRFPDIGAGFWANFASPVIADGRVCTVVPGRGVLAINALDGKEVWRADKIPIDTRNPFTPVIRGDVLYTASNRGFFALNAKTGETLWTASKIIGTPVVDETGVIVAARGGLKKFEAKTGKEIWANAETDIKKPEWKSYFSSQILAAPVISGKFVYAARPDGLLLTINKETGATENVLELGAPFAASAAVSGNAMFLVSYHGTVFALTPAVAGK